MTDIRKCAQAVIDKWETDGVLLDWVCEDVELIEALRQAIAEPVEPVGKKLTREELSHTDGRIEFVWWKDIPHGAFIYTTPPSVDALIAEAVAKEREACAQLCDYLSNREYGVYADKEREELHNEASRQCAEVIRARGQK